MKQKFYCKDCKKEFTITESDHYWNYKCPDCHTICRPKGSVGVKFKGLPTVY